MSFKMSLEQVKATLAATGYTVSNESRNGNNLATVLTLSNGCIVNCWDKGTVNLQGKCTGEVENALCGTVSPVVNNKKVFVIIL